jgi:Arc/MetJ family transcription regulator
MKIARCIYTQESFVRYTARGIARTNIDIDGRLLRTAKCSLGTWTKKATVEEALGKVVRIRSQAGICKLRGKITLVGNLDESGRR